MANMMMYLYSLYVLAYAKRDVGSYDDWQSTLASSLGCIDSRFNLMLMPSEFTAKLREMGAEQPDDSEARRELEHAKEQLATARGGFDAMFERDREVRAVLEADDNETTPAAARRVASAVPDVGPSFRDERERQDAHERLRALIAAGGATETGDRWLFDAAADEIVRLRGEVDRATAEAKRLRGVVVGADELRRQDADLIERLRAEVDVDNRLLEHRTALLQALPCPVHGECHAHALQEIARLQAAEKTAREQGAAEMRERAADALQRMKNGIKDIMARTALQDAVNAVRALPLSGAPGAHPLDADAPARRKDATVKALEAMGVPFGRAIAAARIAEEEGGAAPEAAHSAVMRLAKAGGLKVIMCEGRPDPDMLRTYVRAMLQQAAAGERAAAKLEPDVLTDDEQALLRRGGYVERDGRWRHMWAGPERDPANPEDLAELRRDVEWFRSERGAHMLEGLSSQDVDALVDAMWWRDGDIWRDPRGQAVDPRSAEGVALMRSVAKDVRERKARGPRLIETPADGLSAEDAETLRGAGWHSINGLWREPTGGAVYNPRHSPGINTLRDHAARIRAAKESPAVVATPDGRGLMTPGSLVAAAPGSPAWRVANPTEDAKAPPAASGVTGEPSGGDRAAGGSSSVAEAQGEKQGEARGGATMCAITLENGVRIELGDVSGEHQAWEIARTASLPKPKSVESGQRWTFAHHRFPLEVFSTSSDGRTYMHDEGGSHIQSTQGEMLTSDEWTFLGAPTPQGPSPKRDTMTRDDIANALQCDDEPVFVPGASESSVDPNPRSAYAGRPVTRGTAEPTDGPTARDAVAGMLLRFGLANEARDVAQGDATPAVVVNYLKNCQSLPYADDGWRVCIAALEALDRGDMMVPGAEVAAHVKAAVDGATRVVGRVALDRDVARSAASALQGEVERLTSERDEARAEAAALRVQAEEAAKAAGLAKTEFERLRAEQRATASPPRPAEDIAREMVSVERNPDTGAHFAMICDDDTGAHLLEDNATEAGAKASADAAASMLAGLIERSRAEGKRAAVEGRKDSDGSVSRGAEADVSRSFEAARPVAVRLPVLPADRGPAPAQAGVAPAGEGEAARGDEASDGRVSGRRIEKREDGEWLTGVTWNMSECEEMMTPGDTQTLCCHHVDGHHVANGDPDETGAAKIIARWPIAPAQDEPRVVGVDMGTGPAKVVAIVLRREPSGEVKPLATFEGDDAEQKAREYIAGLPAEDEPRATDEDLVTGWDGATRLELSWPRGADPDAVALAAARLVSAPGALRGDVQVLHAAAAGIRLAAPRDADPRAVLATVAELLGLTGKPVETWGPDERSVEQIEAEAVSSHHKSFKERMLSYAAGIREGERRRQEYGLAAIGELARLQERDAAWSRVTGAGDPEQARSAFLSTGRVAIERARAEGIAEGERRAQARHVESPTVAPDRERLGRAVHEVRREVHEAADRAPNNWETRPEYAREWDRRTGERLFAMGIAEGERRAEEQARATARGLVEKWNGMVNEMERELEMLHPDSTAAAGRRWATGARARCADELCAAFSLPADDKPPTGGEPAPEEEEEVVADRATTHVEPTAGYARRRGLAVPATGWRAEPGMRTALSPTLGQVPVAPFKPWRCECGFEADTPDCHRIMDDPSAAAPYCTLRWARNPDYVTPTDADARWQPGAVWESHGKRYELDRTWSHDGRVTAVRFRCMLADQWAEHLTAENGWRYVGSGSSPGGDGMEADGAQIEAPLGAQPETTSVPGGCQVIPSGAESSATARCSERACVNRRCCVEGATTGQAACPVCYADTMTRAESAPVVPGEASAEERAAMQHVDIGAGVKVTAPDTMTLGEVWGALTSSPALRVCLEAELRAARESARGTTPADLEAARRDIRAAVLEDAFRAGVEDGRRRAHADGIVEGQRQGRERAQRIVTLFRSLAVDPTWAYAPARLAFGRAALEVSEAFGMGTGDWSVSAPDIEPVRVALRREADAFEASKDPARQAEGRAMRNAAGMIESERDARLLLAALDFYTCAIDRVLGTSPPAAQDGSSEPQDEPTEAPRD